jgi:hypothetical protein
VTASLGAWVPLAYRKLTAETVVVKNSAGDVTYDEGADKDYVIDYTNGLLQALKTITDGQALKVDYDYGSISGYKIQAHTNAVVNCKLKFYGKNMDSGEHVEVTAGLVQLTADGLMKLLSTDNEFLSAKITGLAAVPPGQTVPYEIRITA